ncbi:DinB family protein [Christiangramia echinicola]|uniref:DinB superfamily protein n=1 Tax=Christiangramia echinicola TaxID=279359 RepID=A0A1H1M2G8_9FLAO|nr:DinB family protein [Christiangramia echinicola]SDR80840.1 Protein of unknown function [Christiangramia echinicola]
MKNFKIVAVLFILSIVNVPNTNAQNIIEPKEGYTPQIGVLVSMMEDLRSRITSSVEKMDAESTDYLLDNNANSIGAMILHLAATEKYYQVFTFENRGFNKEEEKEWMMALELGDKARKKIKGKSIKHYLDIWEEVRQETISQLKTKDDKWLNSKIDNSSMNNHWAWYHVMEHQANHMGQIRLVQKRIPK